MANHSIYIQNKKYNQKKAMLINILQIRKWNKKNTGSVVCV